MCSQKFFGLRFNDELTVSVHQSLFDESTLTEKCCRDTRTESAKLQPVLQIITISCAAFGGSKTRPFQTHTLSASKSLRFSMLSGSTFLNLNWIISSF